MQDSHNLGARDNSIGDYIDRAGECDSARDEDDSIGNEDTCIVDEDNSVGNEDNNDVNLTTVLVMKTTVLAGVNIKHVKPFSRLTGIWWQTLQQSRRNPMFGQFVNKYQHIFNFPTHFHKKSLKMPAGFSQNLNIYPSAGDEDDNIGDEDDNTGDEDNSNGDNVNNTGDEDDITDKLR